MSLNQLKKDLKSKNIKVIFTDYYDTIIHRTTHPNYALRLWAKFLIQECGLKISIDELYFIRISVNKYLSKKLEKDILEIPYDVLKDEIFRRMVNEEIISGYPKTKFFDLFEKADVKAESSVQYLNEGVVKVLRDFKSDGGKVYLVSDFYASKSLFENLVAHHNISDVFTDIYSSAQLEASKATGSIFNKLTTLLSLNPEEIMMIGDNKISDYQNSTKYGLNAFLLPHGKHLRRNKLNNLGNDFKTLETVIDNVYSDCSEKSVMPFVEYIIFYHFFTERLYLKCKQDKVKNLFFLSREGMYLKKLFDSYQEYTSIDNKINTHYLKISRQASMQINLEDIEKEEFKYLRNKHPSMSLEDFLYFFNCSTSKKETIALEINADANVILDDFFASEVFQNLKSNTTFRTFYENHRLSSKTYFEDYINSFGSNYKEEGIQLVDVGWGGTMQESIFGFFEEKIPVTGYYLGVREIYDIQEQTKRHGLLFSILPYIDYNDSFLMANLQYYEQFSGANHGSALGYTSKANGFVLENHKEEEKWLFDTYIGEHQNQMFEFHQVLLKQLESVCYNQNMVQTLLAKKALKTGLFINSRKLKFIQSLNSGFYQNIGTNKVGISYEKEKGKSITSYIKTFVLTPEASFRYVAKLKPVLYGKNKVLASLTPGYLIYLYYRFNKFVRFSSLKGSFLLKSNFFKTDKTI